MNWTGGKLKQQRKWGKSMQSKQQQHFANVRTKLQNGPDQHEDFIPSFLQEAGEVYSSSRRRRSRPLPARQTKLEEFQTVAPVAHRLSSMTPRTSDYGGQRKSEGDRQSRLKLPPPTVHRPGTNSSDGLDATSESFRNVEDIVRPGGPRYRDRRRPGSANTDHGRSLTDFRIHPQL